MVICFPCLLLAKLTWHESNVEHKIIWIYKIYIILNFSKYGFAAKDARDWLWTALQNGILIKLQCQYVLHIFWHSNSRSIGILVGYSFRIPTQQLGCCYGIDFWKVAGIIRVSLAAAVCHLIYILLLLAVYKTSSFVYFNQQNGF